MLSFFLRSLFFFFFFFLNDPAPTEIYPLPLHDALPIPPGWSAACTAGSGSATRAARNGLAAAHPRGPPARDRKSTRLNSSHGYISYAVFCLKKKKKKKEQMRNKQN